MAQVFNERGDGVVVRGGAVKIDKDDRQPHLTRDGAAEQGSGSARNPQDLGVQRCGACGRS
jgi:hypothetical protein